MRICTHCGHHNKLDARDCHACQRTLGRIAKDQLGDIAQDPTLLIGKVLNGKYEVLKVLGEGGMGVVYKVRHLILQKKNLFALKILHPRFSTDKGFQDRFLREVEVAMELTHENIVQIRDFGVTEHELLFFTMDYFPGETLKSVIKREGAFSPARACTVVYSVLEALSEAHRCGVVHRDLKPDNILLASTADGDQVRILDFGIAKILEANAGDAKTLTQGSVIGTPKYMSPEQASGDSVDERSDFYSLGVVLYELLTGKAPFVGRSMRQIVMAHLSTPPPPFAKIRPDLKIPTKIERFAMKLLAKELDKRPSSATECCDLLLDTGTLFFPDDATVVSQHRLGGRRSSGGLLTRRLAATIAVLFLVAVGGLAVWRNPFASSDSGVAEAAAFRDSADRTGASADEPAVDDVPTPSPEVEAFGKIPPREAPRANAGERTLRCDVCRREYAKGQMRRDVCCDISLREIDATERKASSSSRSP